ncbi:MAG: dethiobiotin synthase [Geobacteraceae bacterium]|nr:dethiobiotin synthase [Geobacteraceae bacterium]
MNPTGVFVTGTDTGVGKTIVSAAIARHLHNKGLRVGVMKPVTSGSTVTGGAPVSEDAQLLRWAACSDAPAGDTSPYVLREPIAPSEAARLEGVTINRWRIRDSFERLAGMHDFMVVEGAGGLLVPLADDLMVADLAKDLGLPLIIVARPGLGTINHTLMTCECAISRGISILGFILNGQEENPGQAEAYASRLIARLSGLPLLGVLGRYGGLDEKEIVTRIADALDREPLADALKGELQ